MSTAAPATEATSPYPAPPAIHARGLTQRFNGEAVVHGIDLDVPAGSIFGFIGPSGSGKTTTIRMLAGISRPSEGYAEVLGRGPEDFDSAHRRRLGYLPQHSVLFPTLTLRQNLSFAAGIYGMRWPRRRRIREVLDLVELWDDRNKRLKDASGGMQRRLALAAALIHSPELCFLDEPTAGVDPILRRKFWDAFAELRYEGRTLFVTTQYVSEAAYCDFVGVISDGNLIALDTPDGLRRNAFGGEVLGLEAETSITSATVEELSKLERVVSVSRSGPGDRALRVVVDRADQAVPRIADWFDDRDQPLSSISEDRPPFDDVFVSLVEESRR